MNSLPRWASAATLIAVVVVAHVMLMPGLASLDSFYHMGHAAQYRAGGLFDTAFPWGTRSIIGDLGADLWWGFHMVLVPFSFIDEPATAIRVAAVALTGALAAAVYVVLRRHGVTGEHGDAVHLHLVQDVLAMLLRGARADMERPGDRLVAKAIDDHRENLPLALRQPFDPRQRDVAQLCQIFIRHLVLAPDEMGDPPRIVG